MYLFFSFGHILTEMGKTRAEIQAAYRQRKREKMGEAAFLHAERARVNKYYTPTEHLGKKKAQERRGQVNVRVRRHRERVRRVRQDIMNERQEEDVNMDQESDTTQDSALSDISYVSEARAPLKVKLPFVFKRKRKRVSRCLSNAHRNIEALTLKLQEATKDKKKIQKRYQRLRKKLPMSSTPSTAERNTPRSKTNSQLRNAGLDPTSVPPGIKKKIIFSNAIIEEVQNASHALKRRSDRSTLHKLVAGSKVLKKYRLLRMLQVGTGLGRLNLTRANRQSSYRRKELRPSWNSLHNEVVAFLQRDDNSRMCPGKNDHCKADDSGTTRQKKFLCDYLHNLHAKYVAENPEKRRVSLSSFKRLRQNQCPHIKPVQFASRNLCLCQKHQNITLKLKAMKSLGLAVNENPDEFIKSHNEAEIDDLLDGLQAEQVQFEEWSRVKVDNRQKTKIIRVSKKREEFITCFKQRIGEFRQHVARVKQQFQALSECKKTLPAGECIVQMDFAENYVCVPLEEVQSGYWSQDGVTLHPIVVYYRDNNNELAHQSMVVVSDEKGHNSTTVVAILRKVIPRLQELVPQLSRVHYWTDSPTSQYRNKTMFSVVGEHAEIFEGIHAQWNYFEAGHGKGPCDGIGGTVKRMADNAVKRKIVIQDAHDFFAWATQEQGSTKTKIEYIFLTKEECVAGGLLIAEKWSTVKTFPGTLQVGKYMLSLVKIKVFSYETYPVTALTAVK